MPGEGLKILTKGQLTPSFLPSFLHSSRPPPLPAPRHSKPTDPDLTASASSSGAASLHKLMARAPWQSGHTWTRTICQKECQMDSHKKCHKECQMERQKIWRIKCQIECQNICQIECQIECQNICQIECQIECQNLLCQIGCQIDCKNTCQDVCHGGDHTKILWQPHGRWRRPGSIHCESHPPDPFCRVGLP